MQLWPGKSPERLYAEVEEQIVHADRLGYDAYAIVEHFFFPRFSIAPDPIALFAHVATRTQRIRFRTMLHVLPFHNPTVLASRIAAAQILTGGRYEFGVGRGHGWAPPKAGVRLEDVRELYDESFEVFFKALENERFSHDGRFYEVVDSHLAPPAPPPTRVFVGGTSDSTYQLAGERGYAMVVPPLLPYEALAGQLDIYREACRANGHEPDIVWIHACYIDEDRDTARREAESVMRGFLKGNASVLLEHADELAAKDRLEASGYGFYSSGIMEELSDMPYEQMIAGDVVWVGTPADVIERIEAVREICDGLTEVSITVNPGGAEHWQAIKQQELFARTVMPHFRAQHLAEAEVV
jgi:alkanesulfonate monooxygenase SsuD/methylene tetrahydromethanopterin reductase-like flavin-dependent oxidoreductase (luciferase family)